MCVSVQERLQNNFQVCLYFLSLLSALICSRDRSHTTTLKNIDARRTGVSSPRWRRYGYDKTFTGAQKQPEPYCSNVLENWMRRRIFEKIFLSWQRHHQTLIIFLCNGIGSVLRVVYLKHLPTIEV